MVTEHFRHRGVRAKSAESQTTSGYLIEAERLDFLGPEACDQERPTAEDLARQLRCDLTTGLLDDQGDIARRQEIYGSNTFPVPISKNLLELALEALDDFTLRVLMASGLLSFVLWYAVEHGEGSGWIDSIAILTAVVVVVAVSATTNYQRDLQFQELAATERNVQVWLYPMS